MYWIYSALSRTGEIIEGSIQGSRQEVRAFVEARSLSVLDIQWDVQRNFNRWLKPKKLGSKILAQFFEDFYNMLEAGISLNQILISLQETTKNVLLKDILEQAQEHMRQGESLVEALCHGHRFPWIVTSTLKAGEHTGRLKDSCQVLFHYFKRSADIQSKMFNAFVYPLTVFMLLLSIMFFISLKVVPKLQVLLPPDALHNVATQFVLILSVVVRKSWIFLAAGSVLAVMGLYYYAHEHKQRFEDLYYRLPVLGALSKESSLALYFLNLSVLLKSGVPLLKAVMELEHALMSYTSRKFVVCREYMLGGMAFSEALKKDAFFPAVVSFSLRKAEETSQISQYCQNLSEFFTKRTQAKVDTMVHFIQPVLLCAGGLFLITIALAFLVPIYGSLSKIAGGG